MTDEEFVVKFKEDFLKDVEHRRPQHRKNNFHYLQYKGILWLNSIYGEEYLRSIGLQVYVPRTFTTVESIRPYLSGRPLDISVKGNTLEGRKSKKKAENTLRGEWNRSGADWQKADAEFYGLLFGTGFLLSKFVDDFDILPLYDGMDKDGTAKFKEGKFQRYKGMKLKSLNPYYVFPDRTATSEEDWRHCFVYSLWDFDVFLDYCKDNNLNTKDLEKGGHIEEFDKVRRQIDMIYGASNVDLKTRDNGQLVSHVAQETQEMDTSNMIMVVEKFSKKEYSICAGGNWTLVSRGNNPDPDRTIPIQPIRDYRVPDEFDGIGEPEVIRWQQYEENKIHNLAYLSTLMNTVQRYGIVESMLSDPTDASFSNPLKWIKLKNVPGADVNKAMIPLNQKNSNDVPAKFLDIISGIRQESTGVSSYITSSPNSEVNTLGEANIMRLAGLERIRQKIYNIEERDIAPILKHWIVCIPQYYTEEMEMLLSGKDEDEKYVIYLPYDRQFNNDISTVKDLSVKYGIFGETTIEGIYKKLGYEDVIFVSDLVQGYDIVIKTATSAGDKEKIITQLNDVITTLMNINKTLPAPYFNVGKLGEEMLRQFPDIIKNVDDYIEQQAPVNPVDQNGLPGQEQSPNIAPDPTQPNQNSSTQPIQQVEDQTKNLIPQEQV